MKVTTRGSFIKQFSGPGENGIICFKFWQAVIASGCPGECAYCFLQTQYPYKTGLYDLMGTLFENLRDIVPETRLWLQQQAGAGLILGENQDGLAFEGAYKKLLGVTPLELLIPLFRDENPNDNTLIVLSKFTKTGYAEELGPCPQVVFSWSLSLPSISKRYEKKVAPLEKRLERASELKQKGYRIRFRLDAMAPIPDWEEEVDEIVGQINAVGPEMLTIGALRATNPKVLRQAAVDGGRDGSIFDYLAKPDPSRFKYRTESNFHRAVFLRVRDRLAPGIVLGLCKEDRSVWQAAGLSWQGCHCLAGATDAVTADRVRNRPQLLQFESPAPSEILDGLFKVIPSN
jgi:hypothetical protein